MFLKMVSLYDKKADAYSPVNCVPNTNAFIRVLSDEINRPDPDEIWAKHPEDFSLVQVGLFDDSTAAIQSEEPTIQTLCELSTLVKS